MCNSDRPLPTGPPPYKHIHDHTGLSFYIGRAVPLRIGVGGSDPPLSIPLIQGGGPYRFRAVPPPILPLSTFGKGITFPSEAQGHTTPTTGSGAIRIIRCTPVNDVVPHGGKRGIPIRSDREVLPPATFWEDEGAKSRDNVRS